MIETLIMIHIYNEKNKLISQLNIINDKNLIHNFFNKELNN